MIMIEVKDPSGWPDPRISCGRNFIRTIYVSLAAIWPVPSLALAAPAEPK